jgi:hypothetical protein
MTNKMKNWKSKIKLKIKMRNKIKNWKWKIKLKWKKLKIENQK